MDEGTSLLDLIKQWPTLVGQETRPQNIRVKLPLGVGDPISLIADLETWSVYQAVWSSLVWNAYRIATIMISSLCLSLEDVAKLCFEDMNNVDARPSYKAIISTMSREVLSTAPPILFPELLERLPPSDDSDDVLLHLTDTPDLTMRNLETPKAGNVLVLLWPLHFVASEPGIPSRNSKTAKNLLNYIGENLGLKIASVLGDLENFGEDIAIPMLSYPIQ